MQRPPRRVSERLRSAPRRRGSRAYHRARSRGADPAHGDLHPALPVAGDMAAHDEGWRCAAGIARRGPSRRRPRARPDSTTMRRPDDVRRHAHDRRRTGRRPGDGGLRAVPTRPGPPRSPMIASWTSRPPLMTWSSTVSPGTRSRRRGQERVVLRDEVDLARSPACAGHDRRGRRHGPASHAAAATSQDRQRDPEDVAADAPVRGRGRVHRGSLWRGDRNDRNARLTRADGASHRSRVPTGPTGLRDPSRGLFDTADRHPRTAPTGGAGGFTPGDGAARGRDRRPARGRGEALRGRRRSRRGRSRRPRRRVLLDARPVRFGQDDDPADDRRLRAPDRRPDPAPRRATSRACRRSTATSTRSSRTTPCSRT